MIYSLLNPNISSYSNLQFNLDNSRILSYFIKLSFKNGLYNFPSVVSTI